MNGLLFTAEVWKAKLPRFLRGEPVQTRRLMKYQLLSNRSVQLCNGEWVVFATSDPMVRLYTVKPRYHTGETVYIKEAWQILDVDPPDNGKLPTCVAYRGGQKVWTYRPATIAKVQCDKWFSPLFMPEWAARYHAEILDVRPERLQDITEEDAKAEGITDMIFWDSINKVEGADNPWVWTITLKKTERA